MTTARKPWQSLPVLLLQKPACIIHIWQQLRPNPKDWKRCKRYAQWCIMMGVRCGLYHRDSRNVEGVASLTNRINMILLAVFETLNEQLLPYMVVHIQISVFEMTAGGLVWYMTRTPLWMQGHNQYITPRVPCPRVAHLDHTSSPQPHHFATSFTQ